MRFPMRSENNHHCWGIFLSDHIIGHWIFHGFVWLDRNSPIYPPTWHILPWGGSAIIPITGDMAIFFITLLSCRRLEWISLFLATSFYHMNPEPTSMEPQNAQCRRSSRSSPRDPRGSGAWNHRSCQKPCQAPAGRCDIEKLTAGYGSKFIGPQQFIYIYSIKLSILRGDNFEPYPHGFLVDNMGLGGCVLIQELCVRG